MSKIEPISGHNDRVDLKDVLPLSTPFTLNVFPINACNFKCSYCAQSRGIEGLKEYNNFDLSERMTLETFKKIVEQSKKFDKPYKLLSFMGHGEPLLNKDLPEMIKLAKDNNIAQRIEIITNGSLLTPELSDAIVDAGVTNVRISLQGLSSEQYKKTSNVNINFEQFLENLTYFHNKGQQKGSNLFVKVMDCSLKEGEEQEFYKVFDKISSRMYVEKVKPVYDGVEFTKDIVDLTTDRYGNTHKPRLACPLAFFSLAVWPNGDISPCDAIYKPVTLGNVNEDDLSEIFNGVKNNIFRLKLLKGKKNNMDGCDKCCAPDDVSHSKDELDGSKEDLIEKYSRLINSY
jgi:radical SAM protein with 4Fe4S-binding SPASM domain